MTSATISTHAITLIDRAPTVASIDVRFDDVRVWSIDVRAATTGSHEFPWPDALLPHLTGTSRVSLHDSASGSQLSSRVVVFSPSRERTSVQDAAGRPLVLNKWGRLGVPLTAMTPETRQLIIDRSTQLIAELTALQLRPFVVGGTLLGAVRTEALLPHDDDADIAYLSEQQAPADVAREAFRVGRALEALGYEIKWHSATHMQLLFRDTAGVVLHYIDVFAAFFDADHHINQPFHVRGQLRHDQLLPFSTVRISGSEFPAPADVNAWLTLNYDANWRTPIPGYELVTPIATRRRFENWFGSFNLHRDFWDDLYAEQLAAPTNSAGSSTGDEQWSSGRAWLTEQLSLTQHGDVIDLGSGDGALTRQIARLLAENPHVAQRVIGVDFSENALTAARKCAADAPSELRERMTFGFTNLYRLDSLLLPRQQRVTGRFTLVAHHLLEQLGHQGRPQVWRLFRMALASGGTAYATFTADPAADVQFEDPRGWHLEPAQVAAEAVAFGLTVVFTALPAEIARPLSRRGTASKRAAKPAIRRRYGATFRLANPSSLGSPPRLTLPQFSPTTSSPISHPAEGDS